MLPQNNYIHIILSSIAVYFFIILAIRLFGKKELAQRLAVVAGLDSKIKLLLAKR